MIPESFEQIGLRFGLVVFGAAVLILIILSALFYLIYKMSPAGKPNASPFADGEGWKFGSSGLLGMASIVALLMVLFMVPFESYRFYDYRVEGTITEVTNRWDDSGGSVSDSLVLTLDTVDQPILSGGDKRFIQLEGEEVVLTCQINWHWRAQDTFKCILAESY